MLNIVLVEPEIPQNTGNIARTCAATGSRLHLIKPLGFKIDDKKLKRAGMDYWYNVDIIYYDNIDDFMEKHKDDEMFFVSTKSKKVYAEVDFPDECYLLFGKESAGIPERILTSHMERCIRIPMIENTRSLNLANSVAIVTYEWYRQKSFSNLEKYSQYFGGDEF